MLDGRSAMDHDCHVTTPDVQPTGRRNARMRQTVGDMARSMAVVLAVVAVIMLLAWRPDPEPIKVVDVGPVIALAAAQAPFAVRAPSGLPDGWRATSARWEPTEESGDVPVLHLGYVTPSDQYAQVSQSTARSAAYLDEQTAGGIPAGGLTIGNVAWEKQATDARRSLVMAGGTTLTVVSGSADWNELAELAASLKASPVPAA
jgi:Protein of unknown function (DUF4245)